MDNKKFLQNKNLAKWTYKRYHTRAIFYVEYVVFHHSHSKEDWFVSVFFFIFVFYKTGNEMKCIFRQIKKKLVYGQMVKNANYLDFVIQIAGI